MIKFGDINILGVFNGDTPITSAYSGSELVFSSKPKYPERSYVFQVHTDVDGDIVPFPIKGDVSTNVKMTWGDGKVNESFSWGTTNTAHLFAKAGDYISIIEVLDTTNNLRVENNPNQGTYEEFNHIKNILHTPEGTTTYKLTGDASKPYSYVNLGLLEDPNVTGISLIYLNALTTDTNKELTIGNFPMSGGFVEMYGEYTKVICKSSFKPSNPSGDRIYIFLNEGCKVTEIDGFDARGIKQDKTIIGLWNTIVLKISNLRIGEFTGSDIKIFNISSTHLVPDLVYIDIKNLGEFATTGQTYDFTGLDAWGDENKAASLGVTGARQSLLDTLVNNSFDVNGKNVTLKLPKSVLTRLSTQAIAAIEAKGYIIPKYDANATVFEMTTTAPSQTVDIPLTSYGQCTVDWGDNITESLNCNSVIHHTYKDAGKYIASILPDAPLSSSAKITGGQGDYKLQYITKFIQLSNTYKYSLFNLKSRYYNYPSDTYYTRHQPNLKETPIIKVNLNQVGITTGAVDNSVNKGTFVIHPQLRAADAYSVDVCGQYDTVKFADNFKTLSNQQFSLYLSKTTSDGILSQVTLILGPANFRGNIMKHCSIDGDMDALLNLRKIESVSFGNITNDYVRLWGLSIETPNLVFLHITNLGENIPQTLTYDFTYHTNWGNDLKAAEFGITGALDSLNRTMIDALDVTGKNVKLNLPDEVVNRLSPEAIKSLQSKGYIVPLLNKIKFKVMGGYGPVYTPIRDSYDGSFTFNKVDWGDGTSQAIDGTGDGAYHYYKEKKPYIMTLYGNDSKPYLKAEFKATGQLTKGEYILEIVDYGSKPLQLYNVPAKSYNSSNVSYLSGVIRPNEVYTPKITEIHFGDLSNAILSYPSIYGNNIKTVVFDSNFKCKDFNDMRVTAVNYILGHVDIRENTSGGTMFYSSGDSTSLWKIEHVSIPKTLNTTIRFSVVGSKSDALTYMFIDNLGESTTVQREMTYDFTTVPNWGSTEDWAEPNSRQSLIDSLITYSQDVSGREKPYYLALNQSTYDRLTADEIALIKAKGYIIQTV